MGTLKIAQNEEIMLNVATSIYDVKPNWIDTSASFFLAFNGNIAMAESARCVVILCQKLKGWRGFKRKEIQKTYEEVTKRNSRFFFNGLLLERFILLNKSMNYFVTKEFVDECFKHNPVRQQHGSIIGT